MTERIGVMFPTGGPVPPELVIGRDRDVTDLVVRITESIHVLVTGPRRIGKTTVCGAACWRAAEQGWEVLRVEVPERVDSRDLLQMVVDACAHVSLKDDVRKAGRVLRPLLEKYLKDNGVPLDVGQMGAEPDEQTLRAVLELPRALAEETGRRVVLFLDELQRVVDYSDGDRLLGDLVDLYGARGDVTLLVDGSDERALQGMLGAPVHFGKLCEPVALSPRIDVSTWRQPLRERFARVDLEVRPNALEELLAFGAGRPYETMLACRHAALTARSLGADRLDGFEAQTGIDAAVAQLEADGA